MKFKKKGKERNNQNMALYVTQNDGATGKFIPAHGKTNYITAHGDALSLNGL